MLIVGTIAFAAVVLFVSTMVYSRTGPFGSTPSCPTCEVPFLVLDVPAEPERRTYDVLVCPECTNSVTRVLGARSRFAWCPACRQRTLETPVHRLPPTPERPLAVEVEEHCHVCGYRDLVELPDGPLELVHHALPDNVLRFPR